jgi:hypothetical protein
MANIPALIDRKVYRVSVPALIDVVATSKQEALYLAVEKLTASNSSYGIGDGEVYIDHQLVADFRDLEEEP